MNLKTFVVSSALLGLFLALIPVLVNAQPADNQTFFKGENTVVLRLNNPYNATQWEQVESYTTQGFRLMTIVPASALNPDPNNPALIFVVMQKFG